MNVLTRPYSLEADRFSLDLPASASGKVPQKSVQSLILYAILNVPGGTTAVIPTYRYRSVNDTESLSMDWSDGTGQEDRHFRAAPNRLQIPWHPYGTVWVEKVSEILDEKIEKHFLSRDTVIRTVQYAWKLTWNWDFAKKILADANAFVPRIQAHLQEKLQKEAKMPTTNITITEKQIRFNAGGSYSRYINFEREGLVDLSDGIQLLGCAYAICENTKHEQPWKIRPYFDINTSYGQCACGMSRDPNPVRKQW